MEKPPLNLRSIRQIAFNYAFKKGYINLADDFAQEYILETFLKGKRPDLNFRFIDFLRNELGSSRKDAISYKSRAIHIPFDEQLENSDPYYRSICEDYMYQESPSLCDSLNLIFISDMHRSVLNLILKGITKREVGIMLKVTFYQIENILEDIKKKLTKFEERLIKSR